MSTSLATFAGADGSPAQSATLPVLPRRKTVFPAARLPDGSIHLGGIDPRWAAILPDPGGQVWALLELMDGTRRVPDLHGDIAAQFPGTSLSEVGQSVLALAEAGYVEDAAAQSRSCGERYLRNEDFLGFWARHPDHSQDLQRRLRQSRVTVVGVGGLGGAVASAFAGLGVGRLQLVDFDHVERSNLNRQFLYGDADVGLPKVVAAARRLAVVNPDVEVVTRDLEIDGVDAVTDLFDGSDLVVCAADRPRLLLHQWMNAASLRAGVPWLYGASTGLTLVAAAFSPVSGCFECLRLAFDDPDRGEVTWLGVDDGAGRELTVSPCVAPTAFLVGGLCSMIGLHLLIGGAGAGGEVPIAGVARYLDVDGLVLHTRPFPRHPGCPACGPGTDGSGAGR